MRFQHAQPPFPLPLTAVVGLLRACTNGFLCVTDDRSSAFAYYAGEFSSFYDYASQGM